MSYEVKGLDYVIGLPTKDIGLKTNLKLNQYNFRN